MTLSFNPAKLCLSSYQGTFDYSTLKAHISKTTNDRNKQISDTESVKLKDSSCTNNIHAQREAQKHCFIYYLTTLITYNLQDVWTQNQKSIRFYHFLVFEI